MLLKRAKHLTSNSYASLFRTIRVSSSLCRKNMWFDTATYTELVQSAAKSGSLATGKLAHSHIIRTGFDPCLFLVNNLLNMYCKCGELGFARKLFDKMRQRNIISYNSMISGYTQMGFMDPVMDLFVEARKSRLKVDEFTYSGALSVCGEIGDLELGKLIHGLVIVNELVKQVLIVNVLIDMYCKCGRLDQATRLFENSDELDQVSWNSLISGYVRVGAAKETPRLLAKMNRIGLKLSTYTLGSVLKACCANSDEESIIQGMMLQTYVIKLGMELDIVVGTALLDMYAKSEDLNASIKVFDFMPNKNVVMYNAMIAGFLQSNCISDEAVTIAFDLFLEMLRRELKPSASIFSSILKACNAVVALETGKQIHALICKYNFQSDEFIGSSLIELYSLRRSTEDALKCFSSIPKLDIASWTSMTACYVHNEQFERAFALFRKLFSSGIKLEEFLISLILGACSEVAASRSGEQIQSYATKTGLGNFTSVQNSNICMCARSGYIGSAKKIFEEVQYPNIATWSAMIFSHASHGFAKDALDLFELMKRYRIEPNQIIFLGVLTACSHGGLVEEGLAYFETMQKKYGINPNEIHYSCVVDLLGRAGRLEEAENLIMSSGFQDHPIMWRALLSSCRVHESKDIGKRVADRVIELEPEASGSYVLLHNMYNDVGLGLPGLKVRELMRVRGVEKEPGLSWL